MTAPTGPRASEKSLSGSSFHLHSRGVHNLWPYITFSQQSNGFEEVREFVNDMCETLMYVCVGGEKMMMMSMMMMLSEAAVKVSSNTDVVQWRDRSEREGESARERQEAGPVDRSGRTETSASHPLCQSSPFEPIARWTWQARPPIPSSLPRPPPWAVLSVRARACPPSPLHHHH